MAPKRKSDSSASSEAFQASSSGEEDEPRTVKRRRTSESSTENSEDINSSDEFNVISGRRFSKRKADDEDPEEGTSQSSDERIRKRRRLTEDQSDNSSNNSDVESEQNVSPVPARNQRRKGRKRRGKKKKIKKKKGRRGRGKKKGRDRAQQELVYEEILDEMEDEADFDPNDSLVLALKGDYRQFKSKYLKQEVIGKGGFGTVFAGVRKSDGLSVAIKQIVKRQMLFTTVTGHSGREYQIPSEVVLLLQAGGDDTRLGMNAAVSLIEWFELRTQIVVVMERPAESMNLRDLVNSMQDDLTEDMSRYELMYAVVKGTAELLDKEVFHRDLKCDNILAQMDGEESYRVRLWTSAVAACWHQSTPGTVDYAPPEFFCEGSYKAEPTCVWQLGAMLYEILHTGKSFNTHEYLEKKIKFKRGISKDCRHFLKSCLKTMPSERIRLRQLQHHPWF
ncbi:hypothetical protein WMY93_001100 [Mugilogobius chulae]|uniref:non-specific serine/threonine protein kinase n=1 Tax=Mugilogobius chulae TaxID=88201 RepID=A0AAW0QBT3_9GOBI